MAECIIGQVKFTDDDIVNPEDFVAPDPNSKFKGVVPWLFTDHGFIVAVVIAETEGEALDLLADSKKIDHLKISDPDIAEIDCYNELRSTTCLGNGCHFYDISVLSCTELPNPKFSLCALINNNK